MKTKISKKTVEAVKPGLKDVFLWDTELPTFGVKITPVGRRVYIVQYRVGGRQRRYTIGLHGPLTPDQARNEARRILGEVAKGHDPASGRAEGRKGLTIADLAERYLSEHAEVKKRPSSVQTDKWLLANCLLPAIGSRKVADLTRSDLAKLHHDLRKTPIQANRVLALASKMFSLTEKWGLRPDDSNPCRHIERFKENKRRRYLSGEELARLGKTLSEVDKEGSELPSAILAIRLLLFTGARLSEILTLKWEHVDFERGVLDLPDSKTGSKLIPLNGPTMEALEAALRLHDNPYVCPGVKPGGHMVGLQKIWERIRNRAGLPDVRLHDLRHSFASAAAASGAGLPLIGALLGHTQAQTTARYAHLALDPLKAATEEIGRRIAESMNQKPKRVKVVPLKKRQ